MFDQIKKEVNLLEQIANDTQQAIVECGTNTYKFEDDETVGCFFCQHHGCLKFFFDEEESEKAGYHCFSCEERGDVVSWTEKFNKISTKEACQKLIREHDIKVSSTYNPVEEIFQLAATYYHNCLTETCNKPYAELGKKTPLEYQETVRHHSKETIVKEQIGWSDGGVVAYLEALGYDEEILNTSGLRSQKTGRDFLPSKVFIYPHYVKGKVSHFTFKDSLKKLAYQLPNKCSLNGHQFYGQDSIRSSDTVFVCEGENDRLSLLETGKLAVIATIGQISAGQLDWMRENLSEKHVITLYDNDEAGDKYRLKTEKISRFFKSFAQITPGERGQDIDELLSNGVSIQSILEAVPAVETAEAKKEVANAEFNKYIEALAEHKDNPESVVLENELEILPPGKDLETNSVVQKRGVYWKVTIKDGIPSYSKISNFVMILGNVYITELGDRHREVIIVREDGKKSNPVLIDSDTKVSLKAFRVLVAKAVDASFRGTERDLDGVWDIVSSLSAETEVKVTRTVGRHEGMKGWIFRNKFISDAGYVIDPDKDGVFWLNGKTVGIRPESLNVSSNGPSAVDNGANKTDIPFIEADLSRSEVEELMKGIVFNLGKNLHDNGQALLLLGWIYASIFSNQIFTLNKSFPFLFMWGVKGKGKTAIAKWLQQFYNMTECGYTSIPQLKSAVGWGRKVEYYSSLPVFIDEIRSDQETKEYISLFRTYYDRTPRIMGVKDGFGVKIQDVRATFIFVGEDLFDDPAARERCVAVRIPVVNRELEESYRWMEDRRHLFSGITFQWIRDAADQDVEALRDEIRALDKEFVTVAGCSQRISKNWAAVGVFAKRLGEKYLPDFDIKSYLFKASTVEASTQKADTTVSQFFETVEAIMAQEHPKITSQHVISEGNLVHIWFPAVFKQVLDDSRGKFPFSKNALLSSMREEPYFVSDSRKVKMGLNGIRRIVLTLDTTNAPDSVKNIAQQNE